MLRPCRTLILAPSPHPSPQVHIAPWGVYAPAVVTGQLHAGQATADAEVGKGSHLLANLGV